MVGGGGEWSRLRQHDELMESGQGGGHAEAGAGSGDEAGGCMLQGLVTCVHRFVQLTSLADKLALHYPLLGLVIANPQVSHTATRRNPRISIQAHDSSGNGCQRRGRACG